MKYYLNTYKYRLDKCDHQITTGNCIYITFQINSLHELKFFLIDNYNTSNYSSPNYNINYENKCVY